MCLFATPSSNFLPQNLHWTLVSASFLIFSFSTFYSWVIGSFLACFSMDLKAKLSCFHLGIALGFCGFNFSGWFLFTFFSKPFYNSSTYGARWAAELKAFLLDWNTFLHTFSCLTMASSLNILPHPFGHSTNFSFKLSCSLFICSSSRALKFFFCLMGASIFSSR